MIKQILEIVHIISLGITVYIVRLCMQQVLAEAYVPENLLLLVETDYNYRLCFHKELTTHGKFLEMTKNGRGGSFF